MLDKNGNLGSSYKANKTTRAGNCRKMQVLQDTFNGRMYDNNHNFNYYTAQMYAAFFYKRFSLRRRYIVKGRGSTEGLRYEKDKKLKCYSSTKISGASFISGKTEILTNRMAINMKINIDLS